MSIWASFGTVIDGYQYDHSAIMPDRKRPRGANVDLAHLSKFVRYYRRRPNGRNPPDGIEPWLRLGVDQATVVLHRKQVATLVEDLQGWLNETGKPS